MDGRSAGQEVVLGRELTDGRAEGGPVVFGAGMDEVDMLPPSQADSTNAHGQRKVDRGRCICCIETQIANICRKNIHLLSNTYFQMHSEHFLGMCLNR